MEIHFVKLNPTQNMTILAESRVPRELQRDVARNLMKYEGLFAEQVGFIEEPENPKAWARLQMMGGEFCGNAALCLAAVTAMNRAAEGSPVDVPLEVSGSESLIHVAVNFKGVEAVCSLEMPGPEKIESRRLALNGRDYAVTVVSMAGITHIIIDALEISGDKTIFAERALWEWKNIFKAEALGLILYDRVRNHIRPLIHVASTGSQVWERGCASGTAALGAALAHQAQGSTAADIAQPGGVISVLATYEAGQIVKTVISGQVKVVARGVAYL